MFQIIISLFVIISLSEGGVNTLSDPDPQKLNKARKNLLGKVQYAKKFLSENGSFVSNTCGNELSNLRIIDDNLKLSINQIIQSDILNRNQQLDSQLQNCLKKIKNEIAKVSSPSEKDESWYNKYLEHEEYKKDFKWYPELRDQFNQKMMRDAHRKMQEFDYIISIARMERINEGIMSNNDIFVYTKEIYLYTKYHPHLQNPDLPRDYNKYLSDLKKARTCTVNGENGSKDCHERLKKQLTGESEEGLKTVCRKALKEGQVCCSNPSKSCGSFSFAKDIAKTFSRNSPGLFQALGNLQTLKGNPAEACKLSQLGSVLGPLGNLQIDGCNKAIEGCGETCQARLDKFKQDVKSCYKIGEKESLEEILERAANANMESGDPKVKCQEQIAELGEAYKEITRESRYSLKEDSDYEELVSCKKEIAKYAPGQQRGYGGRSGMSPTEQMAVNMCYRQLNPTAMNTNNQSLDPSHLKGGNQGPGVGVTGFTGGKTNEGIKGPGDRGDDGHSNYAHLMDDEGDEFLSGQGAIPPANELGFRGAGEGSGGSGGGVGGSSGGGLGGGGEGDNGERSLAGGMGKNKDLPFYSGEEKNGFLDKNSWDAEDRKWDYDRRRANNLKKLADRHLDDEERDLVKMFSTPGKNESIFERASFALHWFCRTHGGCYKYDEAMGIDETVKRDQPWLDNEDWQPPPVPGEEKSSFLMGPEELQSFRLLPLELQEMCFIQGKTS